jgi:hypothetical protein
MRLVNDEIAICVLYGVAHLLEWATVPSMILYTLSTATS